MANIDSYRLIGLQDRRRKLTDWQKDEMYHKYKTGLYSLNSLAREYGVSKKTVLVTVNPNSKQKQKEYAKANWKNWRVSREEHAQYIRNVREHKKRLLKLGQLSRGDNYKAEGIQF